MKKTYNKLTCLFGHHDYSPKHTKDRDENAIQLCRICRKSGYYKWVDGDETWYDYDDEGNCVYSKWSDGLEIWFDKKGNKIHVKWFDGRETWYDGKENLVHVKYSNGEENWLNNNERWVEEKPKNWKYKS